MNREQRYTAVLLVFIAVIFSSSAWLAGSVQVQTHVAVEVSKGVVLLVPRADAIDTLQLYERHTLVEPSDIELYGALQLALGDVGKKELRYSEGHETTAQRKVREWQVQQR